MLKLKRWKYNIVIMWGWMWPSSCDLMKKWNSVHDIWVFRMMMMTDPPHTPSYQDEEERRMWQDQNDQNVLIIFWFVKVELKFLFKLFPCCKILHTQHGYHLSNFLNDVLWPGVSDDQIFWFDWQDRLIIMGMCFHHHY